MDPKYSHDEYDNYSDQKRISTFSPVLFFFIVPSFYKEYWSLSLPRTFLLWCCNSQDSWIMMGCDICDSLMVDKAGALTASKEGQNSITHLALPQGWRLPHGPWANRMYPWWLPELICTYSYYVHDKMRINNDFQESSLTLMFYRKLCMIWHNIILG